jgi:hypothetical protein
MDDNYTILVTLRASGSVFNPGQNHILNINEDDYPKNYCPIIRRLRKAVESEQDRNGTGRRLSGRTSNPGTGERPGIKE